MSKAFTRESDESSELPLARQPSLLPAGAKNYLTADGAQRLRSELDRLLALERDELANALDVAAVRRQLQSTRQRIEHLEQSLRSAVIVQPPSQPWDRVRFGATVTVRENKDSESCYRIVGVDEADVDRDWVSWCSPIARALLNARIGERIRFRAPGGDRVLEILKIDYA